MQSSSTGSNQQLQCVISSCSTCVPALPSPQLWHPPGRCRHLPDHIIISSNCQWLIHMSSGLRAASRKLEPVL